MNEFENEPSEISEEVLPEMPQENATPMPTETTPEIPETESVDFSAENTEVTVDPEMVPLGQPELIPPAMNAPNPVRISAKRKNLLLVVLCWLLAALILFTAGLGIGYILWGQSEAKGGNVADLDSQSDLYGTADVELKDRPAKTDEQTAAAVYQTVNPSVVGIRVYNKNGDASDASGVVYTADGYVITNDHIYLNIGEPHFRIFMYDGTECDADYVAGDTVSDLAVLKIRKAKKLKPAVFGNSEKIICGENVITIGRPYDATSASTITKGIISATSRRIQTTSQYAARLIQMDALINGGSSGGALANMYGQVIGITSSKLSPENGYEGMGFAIPSKTVKRIAEQLISNGKVTDRAKLGISYQFIDSVTAALGKYKTVGLYVSSVTEDSELYGKLKEGDIITHVNGKLITDDDFVLDIIENAHPGDQIKITVLSNKKSTEYTVKLKQNEGTSSYSNVLNTPSNGGNDESGQNGNTFDFPAGE